jgi:hypothetical protein
MSLILSFVAYCSKASTIFGVAVSSEADFVPAVDALGTIASSKSISVSDNPLFAAVALGLNKSSSKSF